MVDAIKPLYTAHGTAIGGRNGHTRSDDGIVDLDLSVPKEMGGPGKPSTGTPEHLFAAGYAACFGGALDFIAKQHKKDASKATVKCAVSIGPREKGGFGLAVVLDVTDASLPQGELQSLAEEAHEKICPYSHATRGNVDVKVVTHGPSVAAEPIARVGRSAYSEPEREMLARQAHNLRTPTLKRQ